MSRDGRNNILAGIWLAQFLSVRSILRIILDEAEFTGIKLCVSFANIQAIYLADTDFDCQ
jgi:hypothetical protein